QHAEELKLAPTQVKQLEDFDAKLADMNKPLDDQVRALDRPTPTPSGLAHKPRGPGGANLNLTGCGRRGRPPAGEQAPREEGQKAIDERNQKEKDLREQMLKNEETVLLEALRGLDPDQRAAAITLLKQHGYTESGAQRRETIPALAPPNKKIKPSKPE